MKYCFALLITLALSACSWNNETGFEGAQGNAGMFRLDIKYQTQVAGSDDLPSIESVRLINGQESDEREAYFELPDGTLVIMAAKGSEAFEAFAIRGDAQKAITGDVTSVVSDVITTIVNPAGSVLP
jgi:hypothetical protein